MNLSELINLKELNLSGRQLTSIPNELWNLSNLKILELDNNQNIPSSKPEYGVFSANQNPKKDFVKSKSLPYCNGSQDSPHQHSWQYTV